MTVPVAVLIATTALVAMAAAITVHVEARRHDQHDQAAHQARIQHLTNHYRKDQP